MALPFAFLYRPGVPEQALGGIPLGFGMVVVKGIPSCMQLDGDAPGDSGRPSLLLHHNEVSSGVWREASNSHSTVPVSSFPLYMFVCVCKSVLIPC